MKRLALIVAIMMMAGLALTGCTTGTPKATVATTDAATVAPTVEPTVAPTEAPKELKMVRWLDSQEPPEMNSILMTDVVCLNLYRHISEGLVRLGQNNNERTPGMAASWDISADGLTYTFHLRDAKWSNGDAVTANDYAFAWKTLLKKETAAPYSYFGWLIKGGKAYNEGTGKVEDLGIEVKDDKTLVVTLEQPTAYFLDICSFGVMSPVNEKFYNTVGADKYGKDADKLLYCGPFVIEKWEHEVGLTLKKNETYFNAAEIKIAGIDMRIVKDSETALNMFLAGDLDIVGVRGAQIKTVEDAGFAIQHYGDGATFYVEFNSLPKIGDAINPVSNKYIRQALSYALDRKGYVSTVLKNATLPATSFTTPEIAGKTKGTFPEDVGMLVKDNDATAAKEAWAKGVAELEALGLKAADIKISMLSDDTDVAKETAAFYKECWTRNLGIDVEVQIMPFKSRLELTQGHNFMMSSSGWGPDYNDPMTFLDMFETGNGNNHTSYSSAAYDDLLAQVRKEPDLGKKYDIYYQLEKMLMDDMPIAPIYWRVKDFTTVSELKGVVRNALQDTCFVWAYFEEK